ncbi:MAG: S26 family signal peptidase [Nocardioides sp.]|nr:S26 family signal peptidase [Nocardioides sp.]
MSERTRRRVARGASLSLLLVIVGLLLWASSFRLGGGSWERVQTPSMGTTAPVGSLLWLQPVPFETLDVGDFISFREPDRPSVSYSHRIIAIEPDGSLRTQGELSGADPWSLGAGDVLGEVVRVTQGVGWLAQAAPILAVGGVLTWGATLLARRPARVSLAVIGASFTLTAAIVVLQPLTGVQQLGSAPLQDGRATSSYVSTGLLPIRVGEPGGETVVLSAGQDGSVTTSRVDPQGRLAVEVVPAVPRWFSWLLALACFLPALWSTVVGAPARSQPPTTSQEAGSLLS